VLPRIVFAAVLSTMKCRYITAANDGILLNSVEREVMPDDLQTLQ
jgi:hypothetical protein